MCKHGYYTSASWRSHLISFYVHEQQTLNAVDALLSMCDENGLKERQGLEECALAFKKYTTGDLDKRLDTLMEVWQRHALFLAKRVSSNSCFVLAQRFWWLQGKTMEPPPPQ